MFEKASPVSPLSRAMAGGLRAGPAAGAERFDGRADHRAARRAGEALRAVEWSELTARLNAARDLRLLLRTENQPAVAVAAASFGDAAASYFALLDNDERGVNLDALGHSKALGARDGAAEANRRGDAKGSHVDASHVDAREKP